jgi:zinc transporter, ZIP family
MGARRPTPVQYKAMLAFAAGVMLAASFFSLIMPAVERARERGASDVEASAIVTIAVLLGATAIALLNRFAPRAAEVSGRAREVRRLWLFVAAITLHNVPEGMAVGVSFAGDISSGIATAIGIGTQNVPEGLAVGFALMAAGLSRFRAWLVALGSGLVEPVAGIAGAAVVSMAMPLLPWALGFAAGAMIHVVASGIIPDTQTSDPQKGGWAAAALMIGLGAMMFLDIALG